MNDDGLKKQIEISINNFDDGNFKQSALALFKTLGYSSNKTINIDSNPESFLTYSRGKNFNKDKAKCNEWHSIDLLFQITSEELSKTNSLFDTSKVDNKEMESYIFYAIELKGAHYSRTDLASITREVNKIWAIPALILFKYNGLLTISIIGRRLNKKDGSKDVLEKVILIKDIYIANAHRAHKDILYDMSLVQLNSKGKVTSFVELHTAWMQVLNISELNKRFYHEIADWYLWARKTVKFPDNPIYPDLKTSSSINTIRLLTRIIFVWFLKEKELVPGELFDENELKKILEWDKDDSCYYKAILQNLFFATLNTEMNKDKKGNRGFADEGPGLQSAHYGVKTLYRYQNLFKISKNEAIKQFENIPFLNGGLFDCLDKEEPSTKKVNYIDGFTRNKKLQPIVPNKLFFGGDIVNLEKEYGDTRGKEKVSGLIEILNSYKFTVAENTPVEEEIALDPELLGKVFENLLASYNPETEITARKQMGAFYTPREIVNYMVDEALTAYLKNYLIRQYEKKELVEKEDENKDIFGNYVANQIKLDIQKKELSAEQLSEIEDKIRVLLSYSEEQPFPPKEKLLLIKAIEKAKILDPACGSGAFPMGVLHKLVFVLHKLDPKNNLWKERQLHAAGKIDDSTIREEVISYIETAFNPDNNFADYGRKLFLIQNCIYGVDIQEVAVQISKLRFFISLLIDQKVNKDKPNNGILSLPNLETRFIAANTLIGIDNNLGGFFESEIKLFENKLKIVREKHFNAKSRAQKTKAIEEEKQLREELVKKVNTEIEARDTAILEVIANQERERKMRIRELAKPKLSAEKKKALLKEIEKYNSRIVNLSSEMDNNTSAQSSLTKIAYWEPYDQNTHAEFFDPDWMFGIKEGFDIVIGNPPYGIVFDIKAKEEYEYLYLTFKRNNDIYVAFIEKSISLLCKFGILSFITPNTYLNGDYFKLLRKYLKEKTIIQEIIDFKNSKIFQDPTVYVSITMLQKANLIKVPYKLLIKISNVDFTQTEQIFIDILALDEKPIKPFNKIISKIISSKLRNNIAYLDDNYYVKDVGFNYWSIGKGKKRDGNSIGDRILYSGEKKNKNDQPFLKGKDIIKYSANEPTNYLRHNYNKYLQSGVDIFRYSGEFLEISPKIIYRQTANRIIATMDYGKNLCDKTVHIIVPKTKSEPLMFLLALLNSKLFNYFYKDISQELEGRTFAQVKTTYIKQLPLIESDEPIKNIFGIVVSYLIAIKRNYDVLKYFFECLIDSMVYELYFTDEIKAANAEVLKYLTNLPALKDDWSDKKKLSVIENVYKELSASKHSVSIAMERQKTIPEIRIIEGLDKEES